jgi:hypothetical protein
VPAATGTWWRRTNCRRRHPAPGGAASTDPPLGSVGTWSSGSTTTLDLAGGQIMHFHVRNVNALGASLAITSNIGGTQSKIIPAFSDADFTFTIFSREPVEWVFSPSFSSDGSVLAWKLYSSWLPGDPVNNSRVGSMVRPRLQQSPKVKP